MFPRKNFVPPRVFVPSSSPRPSPRDINAAAMAHLKVSPSAKRGSLIVVPPSPRKSFAYEVPKSEEYEMVKARSTGVGGKMMKIHYSTVPDHGARWDMEWETSRK